MPIIARMQVYLDDAPIGESVLTLAEAIELGRVAAAESGRIIVEVRADGERVSDESLGDPSELAREGFAGEVQLVSEDPKSLVRAAMTDAACALGRLRTTQAQAAELIHSGRVESAVEELRAILLCWEQAKMTMEQSAELVGPLPIDQEGMKGLAGSLSDRLRVVRQSLEAQDWSTLADELEFELDETADRWRTALLEVAEKLA